MTITPTIRPEIKKENERQRQVLPFKRKAIAADPRNGSFLEQLREEIRNRKK